MINLYNGTGHYSYSGTRAGRLQNWVLDAVRNQHRRRADRQALHHLHAGQRPHHARRQGRFLQQRLRRLLRGQLEGEFQADPEPGPALRRLHDSAAAAAQHADAADHALHFHHQHPQGPVRAAFRRRLADHAENRAAHRLRHLLRQDHQQHLLRHPRGERRLSADVQLQPADVDACPALTFPNVIWTPPGPRHGRSVRRRPDAAGDHLHPARRHSGDARPGRPTGSIREPTRATSPWNAQLPGQLSASVAYVVSRGLHLPIFVDANLAPSTTTKTYDILNASGATAQTYTVPFYTSRINTNTGGIFVGSSDVNSWYNSMVITLRRPMRHGLEFTVNYTLEQGRSTAARWRERTARSTAPIIPSIPTTASSNTRFRISTSANGSWPTPYGCPPRRTRESAGPADSGWLGALHHRDHVHRPAGDAVHQRLPPSRSDGGVTGGVSYAGRHQRPRRLAAAQLLHRSRLPQRGLPAGTAVRHHRTAEAVAHRRGLQPVQPHQCLRREHHRVLLRRGRVRRLRRPHQRLLHSQHRPRSWRPRPPAT